MAEQYSPLVFKIVKLGGRVAMNSFLIQFPGQALASQVSG